FQLAQESERQGEAGEADALAALDALVARSGNLAARLDLARLQAKRNDAEGLRRTLAPLREASSRWPDEAKEQLAGVEAAASGSPRAAATQVAFLKNVLLRTPEYRHALAAVSTPREEIGRPLETFLAIPNPKPQPAPADMAIAFETS